MSSQFITWKSSLLHFIQNPTISLSPPFHILADSPRTRSIPHTYCLVCHRSLLLWSFGNRVQDERSTASHRSLSQERMIACWTLATASASAKPGSPCLPVTTECKKL